MKKLIFWLFAILFFFVPLILWPFTSEVFEFNKIVLVYILTTLIVAAWGTRCIIERKLIFRRTILDIPLLVFFASQLISTLLSIDPRTSWFGYYSRFNGGLLSVICYSLLYWAFVSNLDKDAAVKEVNLAILPSAVLVSLYGVAEHFGIDKNIWVQDVQSRVFSTLGQPNWLAAWLIALIPVTWALSIEKGIKNKKSWIYFALSILFFWVLIFTKSRSGYLGFAIAFIIFWGYYFWQKRTEYKKVVVPFLAAGLTVVLIVLISGTEYTPSIFSILNPPKVQTVVQPTGPALETGGTQSSIIRKIVWTGALQIWLHYPIFGTGVETFAYSYYQFRPAAHNLVSEWDFIYNKAHNEFLNMAANSGTIGIAAYLYLIGAVIYLFIKNIRKGESPDWNTALLAGFMSLHATNFFGFSVVPTQLEFFLFPALAISLGVKPSEQNPENKKITTAQKTGIFLITGAALIIVWQMGSYWTADTLYAKGKAYDSVQKPDVAVGYLTNAINLEPDESLYHSELSSAYTTIAVAYNQQKDTTNAKNFADLAIAESDKSVALSPANVNLKRTRFGVYIMLTAIDQNYLLNAQETLLDAIAQAPTDAKLYYNLGLTYARIGQSDKALETLKKTVDLKANYKEARLAYAILLIDKKNFTEAKAQLNYILTNIDPNDSLTKQTLESIK